jgi:hypothetical protein
VAANYEGTDLRVATNFDLTNRDLGPYVAAADGYADEVSVRRGGAGVVGRTAERRLPDDQPVLAFPPENERLNALRNEKYPVIRQTEEPLTIGTDDGENLGFSGGRTTEYLNGQENDQLNEFVQKHRDTLLQLEAVVIGIGAHERLPLSDLIVHAWHACPGIIRNRADLVHSAANTYAELRTAMDLDLKQLKLYWEGSAAVAFSQYADSASAYLTQVEAQTRWLAEEGKKAASMLEGLRNAYAAMGYEQIGKLIEALHEYATAFKSPVFASCSKPEKAVVDAVEAFVLVLEVAEKKYLDALGGLIKINEQERRERPDIGSRGHDVVPFPRTEVGPAAWTDERGWKINPRHPLS